MGVIFIPVRFARSCSNRWRCSRKRRVGSRNECVWTISPQSKPPRDSHRNKEMHMTGMNHRMQRMGISASDLSDAVRMIRRLCLPSTNGQSRMDALIHEMSRIMEAECACVYESRGRFAGVMTELYRHQWRDWQTEALAESMNGRRLSDITQACTYMVWNAPSSAGSKGQPCWYCVASCLPAGANYFLTLAFARRAHPFSKR